MSTEALSEFLMEFPILYGITRADYKDENKKSKKDWVTWAEVGRRK
jgi:hypothetical protein